MILTLATGARAQIDLLQRAPEPDGTLTVDVRFGWDGRIMPAERFSPLRLTVNAGEQAGNFVAVVAFDQDATQHAQVRTPFALTAGRVEEVDLILAIPVGLEQALVSVRTEAGRVVAQRRFTRSGVGEAMPTHVGLNPVRTVLGLGLRTTDGLFRAMPAQGLTHREWYTGEPEASDASNAWERPTLVLASVGEAPLDWAAYDSVDVVVLDARAGEALEPRSRDALLAWVDAGGWLVVLAHDPGARVLDWLPEGEPLPAELGAVAERTLPGTWLAAVPGAAGDGGAAPRAALRPVSLTADGARTGWVVQHELADDPAAGMLAEGPAGLGMLTVVGFNPDRAMSALESGAQVAAWRAVLERSVLGVSPAAPAPDRSPARASAAVREALDAAHDPELVATATGVGFAIIIGSGLALVLLISVVDMICLKRWRLQHRAWLVALGWIGLACTAAWIAPDQVRSGDSVVFRYRVLDVVAGEGPSPSRGHQTAVTGVFVGGRTVYAFEGLDPEAWVRGVSVLDEWAPRRRLFPDLLLDQRERPGARRAGSQPGLLAQGISTYRAFQEFAPVRAGLWASVRPAEDMESERYAVTVVGLPVDAQVRTVHVLVGERWHLLTEHESSEGTLRGVSSPMPEGRAPAAWSAADHGVRQTDPRLRANTAAAPDLARAFDRSRSLEARARGRSAVVLVDVATTEPSLRLATREGLMDTGARERHVWRIAVPLAAPQGDLP